MVATQCTKTKATEEEKNPYQKFGWLFKWTGIEWEFGLSWQKQTRKKNKNNKIDNFLERSNNLLSDKCQSCAPVQVWTLNYIKLEGT